MLPKQLVIRRDGENITHSKEKKFKVNLKKIFLFFFALLFCCKLDDNDGVTEIKSVNEMGVF